MLLTCAVNAVTTLSHINNVAAEEQTQKKSFSKHK